MLKIALFNILSAAYTILYFIIIIIPYKNMANSVRRLYATLKNKNNLLESLRFT